jgi:hypothetical protein
LAGPYERGTTGDAIKELIQLRKAIEAIDAAIPDEQRDSVPKSGTMKNFSTDDPYSEEEPGG